MTFYTRLTQGAPQNPFVLDSKMVHKWSRHKFDYVKNLHLCFNSFCFGFRRIHTRLEYKINFVLFIYFLLPLKFFCFRFTFLLTYLSKYMLILKCLWMNDCFEEVCVLLLIECREFDIAYKVGNLSVSNSMAGNVKLFCDIRDAF